MYSALVQICYVDEAGGCEDPASAFSATPAMVILGLVVDAALVPGLTRDFLALKRRHFPGRFTAGHALDHILVEIKGNEILQMTRSTSRNLRRQAQRIRGELLDLAETYSCHIVGRVWVKEPGKHMDPTAVYCYSVQDIASHFSEALSSRTDVGIVIADGRTHKTNLRVAHSIFTQKWRTGGDPYPLVHEVPLFAASDNHAGLQLADLLASTLIFPNGRCWISTQNRWLQCSFLAPLPRGSSRVRRSDAGSPIPLPRRDGSMARRSGRERSWRKAFRVTTVCVLSFCLGRWEFPLTPPGQKTPLRAMGAAMGTISCLIGAAVVVRGAVGWSRSWSVRRLRSYWPVPFGGQAALQRSDAGVRPSLQVVVDFAAVSKGGAENDESIVVYRIDDAVVADADPKVATSAL